METWAWVSGDGNEEVERETLKLKRGIKEGIGVPGKVEWVEARIGGEMVLGLGRKGSESLDPDQFVCMMVDSEDACFWRGFFIFLVVWTVLSFAETKEKVGGGGGTRTKDLCSICSGEGELRSWAWGRLRSLAVNPGQPWTSPAAETGELTCPSWGLWGVGEDFVDFLESGISVGSTKCKEQRVAHVALTPLWHTSFCAAVRKHSLSHSGAPSVNGPSPLACFSLSSHPLCHTISVSCLCFLPCCPLFCHIAVCMQVCVRPTLWTLSTAGILSPLN